MKILDNLDLSKAELRNAAIQVLASAPSSPVLGQVYFDSTTFQVLIWNGSSWANRATDAALLNANNAAYYLARANHTGSQPSSTISDLASVVKAYRLDEFAVPTANLNLNGRTITGLITPVSSGQAATYDWVLDRIQMAATGISVKTPVRLVATSNVALAGLQTIDGISLLTNDRVLLVGQTDATKNGVYVATSGTWTRTSTEDETSELKGAFWLVNSGVINSRTQWIVNNTTAPVVGTDNLVIVQFGSAYVYTGSNGVSLVGADFSAAVVSGGGVLTGTTGLQIDTSIVARKYSQTIGDGSSNSIAVTHNLGTSDIALSIRDAATNAYVLTSYIVTNTNTVTLVFKDAPAASAYRVTIHA